jgi:tetratricopeptide (TPR) repeat protein
MQAKHPTLSSSMYFVSRLTQNRDVTPPLRNARHSFITSFIMLAVVWVPPVSASFIQNSSTRQRKAAPRPVQAKPATKTKIGQPSVDANTLELQRRIEAEKTAVSTGNPQAVADSARKLAALALLRVADLRTIVGSYPQAMELYRKSLALEDVPQTRLLLATAALTVGQPDETIAQTTKLIENDPDNSRLWYLNGKAWMGKHDYHSALKSLKRSQELHSDVNTQYALALSHLRLKDKAAAEEIFKTMLQDQGDRPIWHIVFGGAYRECSYWPDAAREFRRAIALDNNTRAHLYLALALLEQNGWAPLEESARELKEAILLDPKDFYANLYLGLLESQTDQLEDSNKHLKLAAELDSSLAETWLYLGLNAFKQKNNQDAKKYLLKAVEQTGTNEALGDYEIRRGYIALARIEFASGNTEQAKKYTEKVKELKAKAMAEQAEGIAEIAGGMGAPAVIPHAKLPDQALPAENAPVDLAARLELSALTRTSLSAAEQKRIESAEHDLRVLLSNAFNDWGTADARNRLYPLALQHFQEAEQWDNSTPGVMRNVGLAALKTGDQAEAIRAFKVAVEIDPKDFGTRAKLGMLLFGTSNYLEASKNFEALGDVAYQDPAVAYALAYSLARLNQQKSATDVLHRLSTLQVPAELLLSIGDLYSVFQDYENSVVSYRKALQLDPRIAKAHYKLGAALIRLSRPAEAIPELEAELGSDPGDADVQFNLAYALLATSQKEKAAALLNSITASHPEHPQAQYEFGKLLLENGKTDEAISHLEVAAKLNPETDYVHYQLQSAYRKAGRKEEADREAQIYKDIKTRKREQATIPMPEKKE